MKRYKVYLRSGRILEISCDQIKFRVALDHSKWLYYKVDGLSNRIAVAEIESVHQVIELPEGSS